MISSREIELIEKINRLKTEALAREQEIARLKAKVQELAQTRVVVRRGRG